MAAPFLLTIASRRLYQPGTVALPATAIGAEYSAFKIAIDRTEWLDPAIKIAGAFDVSLDGGQTWIVGWVKFTAEGGPLQPPSPLPDAPNPNFTTVESDIPGLGNANRMIRTNLDISGAAVRISADITLT